MSENVIDIAPRRALKRSEQRTRLISALYPEQMTRAELLEKARETERAMMALEDDFGRLADAVWPPEEHGERPDEPDAGFTIDDLIAGIRSLHELTDLLTREVLTAGDVAAQRERDAIVAFLRRVSDGLPSAHASDVSETLDPAIDDILRGAHYDE